MASTLWESMNRSFLSDLERGKFGEKVLFEYLQSRNNIKAVVDISNTEIGIKDDIDFEIEYKDGHKKTVEIKTDLMAHRTGNIVYEEFSHRNPGCFARTKADYILYYIVETNEVYVLNPDGFREFISQIKTDEALRKELRVRPTKMGQGAYGYLVPIKSIINNKSVCESTFSIKLACPAA